jgi:hypothetical protein
MRIGQAHIRGGRLVLGEPTDLPEGEAIELVPLDEVLPGGGDYPRRSGGRGAGEADRRLVEGEPA